MTSVAITFKPLYGVRSEDPLCYVLEIDEVGVPQQLATCSYAVYLTQTVCCCSYYYHHIALCVFSLRLNAGSLLAGLWMG